MMRNWPYLVPVLAGALTFGGMVQNNRQHTPPFAPAEAALPPTAGVSSPVNSGAAEEIPNSVPGTLYPVQASDLPENPALLEMAPDFDANSAAREVSELERKNRALAFTLADVWVRQRQLKRQVADLTDTVTQLQARADSLTAEKKRLNQAWEAVVHYNLGVVEQEYLRRPRQALAHYEKFLALAPQDPSAPEVRRWVEDLRRGAE